MAKRPFPPLPQAKIWLSEERDIQEFQFLSLYLLQGSQPLCCNSCSEVSNPTNLTDGHQSGTLQPYGQQTLGAALGQLPWPDSLSLGGFL